MTDTSTKAVTPAFVADALTICRTHLLQFVLDDTLPVLTKVTQYDYKSKAEILFNQLDKDQLRVDIRTTITIPAKFRPAGAGKIRVQVQLAVIFSYRGLDELREIGNLPLPLAWTAVSIAYSTMRGQLQVRLAGTSFGEALLPIVSPPQLWQPPIECTPAG